MNARVTHAAITQHALIALGISHVSVFMDGKEASAKEVEIKYFCFYYDSYSPFIE